ncbi:MAG: HyaD/HybD family hydrogenase maturation endopeptidase [Candidatus Competibacteraceae bacterium]|nr:HyaD/HybD family hydrogenase maturation endopeptidase [Candidatus Competibacteraceae bacterium]
MSATLILGIGNTLLSDEGTGVHVVHYLQQHYPNLPEVTYLDGGTLSFTLAGPIADADNLIVIDAAHLEAEPGAMQIFVNADMDRFLGTAKLSVHEVGLADLIDIARLTDTLPARRVLVGIQPFQFGWGDQPSPAVAATIPKAASKIMTMIQKWQGVGLPCC